MDDLLALAEKALRPFSSLRAQVKPRIVTPEPSVWMRSASRGSGTRPMEMPGMRLTVAQACRFWQLDPVLCAGVLDHLVSEGFLRQTGTGFYVVCGNGGIASDGPRRH